MTKTYYKKKEFNRLTEKVEFRLEKADLELLLNYCKEQEVNLSLFLRTLVKNNIQKK